MGTATTRYLTDETTLYEIVSQRTLQNYGRKRGAFITVIVTDCYNGETFTLDPDHYAKCREVKPNAAG